MRTFEQLITVVMITTRNHQNITHPTVIVIPVFDFIASGDGHSYKYYNPCGVIVNDDVLFRVVKEKIHSEKG